MLSTASFLIPEDICNRALQHLGADHQITTLADNSKQARLLSGVYHKLRQAELRRDDWDFAIQRRVIYPITPTTQLWTPPTYAAGTTYPVGAVVLYNDGLGARLFLSTVGTNLGNTPGTTTQW